MATVMRRVLRHFRDCTLLTVVLVVSTAAAAQSTDAPIVETPPAQALVWREFATIQIVAIDPNDESLAYTASSLPGDLSIDRETGLISGHANELGLHEVTVVVSNRTSSTEVEFSISIRIGVSIGPDPVGPLPPTISPPLLPVVPVLPVPTSVAPQPTAVVPPPTLEAGLGDEPSPEPEPEPDPTDVVPTPSAGTETAVPIPITEVPDPPAPEPENPVSANDESTSAARAATLAMTAMIDGVLVDIFYSPNRQMIVGETYDVTVLAQERSIDPAPVPDLPADEGPFASAAVEIPELAGIRLRTAAAVVIEPAGIEKVRLRRDDATGLLAWRHIFSVKPEAPGNIRLILELLDVDNAAFESFRTTIDIQAVARPWWQSLLGWIWSGIGWIIASAGGLAVIGTWWSKRRGGTNGRQQQQLQASPS